MTDDNTTPTEWLANGPTGYGWGRTQQDALRNMFAHMDPWSDDLDELTVDTVEHRGDATVGLTGWRVDEFVSGERLTFDADEADEVRVKLMRAFVEFEKFDETADVEELTA